MKSYFAWWFKYRIYHRFPRFWYPSWWKNTPWYAIRQFFYFIIHKYPLWAQWGIPSYLTDIFLKATDWLEEGSHGYPGMLAMLDDGIADDEPYDEARDDPREKLAVAKWKEIIHKIRFAHFYMAFIQEDEFFWMIDDVKDREYARRWALKKYKYVKEFLTEEFFNTMYDDESLKYETKMDMIDVPGKDYGQIKFHTIYKPTGEDLEERVSSDVTHPQWRIAKELKPQFDEGMELWKRWYQALWD